MSRGRTIAAVGRKLARELAGLAWPTGNLPEVMASAPRPCAGLSANISSFTVPRLRESLASENASRLAAMQRADKNIDELLETFKGAFHRLRQSGIDRAFRCHLRFEALSTEKR